MYRQGIKRCVDFIVSTLLLILIAPFLFLLFILVRLFLGSPAIFKQQRPGYLGNEFYIYKFRTMRNAHHSNGEPLPDHQRLTRFGRLMRSLSLDELPELLNVIKGDMSLIGPRPLLTDYLPYYSKEQMRRHHVRPGITGWAQVNGRNSLSWEQKFKLDTWYVDHCSFTLDCKIIILTLLKIIKREGINASTHVTMTRFDLECQKKE